MHWIISYSKYSLSYSLLSQIQINRNEDKEVKIPKSFYAPLTTNTENLKYVFLFDLLNPIFCCT